MENGDLNWYQIGRFLAFAGPHAERECSPGGYYTLRPEDYISYFKRTGVSLVVRLNKVSHAAVVIGGDACVGISLELTSHRPAYVTMCS